MLKTKLTEIAMKISILFICFISKNLKYSNLY
jgi:hypothetical protein